MFQTKVHHKRDSCPEWCQILYEHGHKKAQRADDQGGQVFDTDKERKAGHDDTRSHQLLSIGNVGSEIEYRQLTEQHCSELSVKRDPK